MSENRSAWIADMLAVHRIPQKDLASALGLDPSAITRLLRGERKLKDEEVPLVHAFFAAYAAPRRMPPPRLLRALGMKDVDLAEVARRSGLPETRLLEIKLGQGEEPGQEERTRIANAFSQEPDFLFAAGALPETARGNLRDGWIKAGPRNAPPAASGGNGDRIPVYRALAPAGRDRYFADMIPAQKIRPPEQLEGVSGAFGVRVADGANSPMLLIGDTFFVNPGLPPLPGGRVFVRFEDGTAMVGLLDDSGKRPAVLGIRGGRHEFSDPERGGTSVECIVLVWAR